ncbi:MAG: glycoside hydrolase family 97 protein [Bacteroidales bacterium]|nr:glycoside hydrolase family 97 protein [Bacteroidales bacterium]
MKRIFTLIAIAMLAAMQAIAASPKTYTVTSPDGKVKATVTVGEGISYTIDKGENQLLAPSAISMTLSDGIVYGDASDKVRKVLKTKGLAVKDAILYKKDKVRDNYNQLTLVFKEFDLVFRAYDDGIAYRFAGKRKGEYTVEAEQAQFRFASDPSAYISYVNTDKPLEEQFCNSQENLFAYSKLSEWDKTHISYAPLYVEAPSGEKLVITESDLVSYPGLNFYGADGGVDGVFALRPAKEQIGGHNMLQGVILEREKYLAKCDGPRTFPWRTVIVADNDKELIVNDMVWKLAPDPEGDFSWVKPGKVAWDWWNAWNIYGVDFRAGINNDTYKYYIDFAAKYGIEYVILDEGWAVNKKTDLMLVIPEIDLPMLSQYAQDKGVGLILWAGYKAFDKDMDAVCKHYSQMGIKGFKIDFMDRDDQIVVDFYHRAAQTCAKYGLMADFHGAFKPSGLNRTWPNVVNYEGVYGLEQMKWSQGDMVTHDVTLPFIRMVAGPMDYTQGAMRNATKSNYRPVNSEPMSQGTRCHQLAEYMIFDAPFSMLCDSPSNYIAEPVCTDFIAKVPTVWDETVPLDCKIREYVAIARRSGNTWYVGAITNWDAREMELDLSFLGPGKFVAEVYKDGVNADRAARDFKKERIEVPEDGKVKISMAPGGGWAAVIAPAPM